MSISLRGFFIFYVTSDLSEKKREMRMKVYSLDHKWGHYGLDGIRHEVDELKRIVARAAVSGLSLLEVFNDENISASGVLLLSLAGHRLTRWEFR